jgi:predicted dehydrogenase
MKRIGVAVVGLGAASQPHAQSLMDLADRVDVRWAASRSAERAQAFAAAYPFPVTTDIATAINDPAVEAVLILTPPSAHLEIAEACFAAGKHVLVEKPLEVSLDRAERLVALSRASGKRFGVVLQHRFRPGARRLQEILSTQALGRVEAASVSVPWWRPQSYYDVEGRGTLARDGGGVLITQAIHAIDVFRALVGVQAVEAARVTTTSLHRMETEDYAIALVRLRDGGPGSIMATTAMYPGLPERIEIIGSLGTAVLAGGGLDVSYLDGRFDRVEAEGRTGSGANIMDFPNDAHRDLIADFLACVVSGGDPYVSGEDALETHRLIEDILATGRTQGMR